MSINTSIRFPNVLHAEITAQALRESRSFSQQVILLCERGLTPRESDMRALSEREPKGDELSRPPSQSSSESRATTPAPSRSESASAACPKAHFHRPGSYCKFCDQTIGG